MAAPADSQHLTIRAPLDTDWPWRLFTLLACAITAHLLLSPLGFNPTDDGFVLAQSRRILSGEVPHRDFISVRPAGSGYIHVLDLLLGGEHTFLVSRLIYWLEIAIVCWCWLEIVIARSRLRPGHFGAAPLAVVAFMLSTHTFPAMAWHTVDGILLASLGFLLAGRGGRISGLLGYALIGAAAICKQNFLPLLPLAVILLGDAWRLGAWAAALSVPALYGVGLVAVGAARDMRLQLAAMTGLREGGLERYVSTPWFAAGVVAGALIHTLLRFTRPRSTGPLGALPWLAPAAMGLLIAIAARRMNANGFQFIDTDVLLLLGATIGALLTSLGRGRAAVDRRAATFVAALGLCSAISRGYQTPAHVAGPLAIVLALGVPGLFDPPSRPQAMRAGFACAVAVLLFVGPRWWSGRRDHLVHELTAPSLTRDLSGVLPGGAGIRTDENTFALLQDLRETVDRQRGSRYAIIVDVPGWWACARQRNPLPTDWPQAIELPTEALQMRFSASVIAQRADLAVLVQRSYVVRAAEGFVPLDMNNPYYGAAIWVTRTLQRESETRYWGVYR